MSGILLLAGWLLLAGPVGAQAPAAADTLRLALVEAQVLADHPRARAVEADRSRARSALAGTHAGLLPRATLASNWSRYEGVGDFSAQAGIRPGDESQTHSVVLSQTLFAGGRSLGQAGAGWNTWRAAQAAHREALAELRYEVRAAYLDWLAAREALAIAEGALAFAARQLERAVQQEELGAGSRIDRLFFENSRAQVEIQLESAAVRETTARLELEALLQRPLAPQQALEPLEGLVAGARAAATPKPWPADQLPALAGLRHSWLASRWNRLASGGSVLPTLSATLSWSNRDSEAFGYRQEANDRLVGLSLSWTLFQGFSGASAVLVAGAQERRARAGYENARLSSEAAWQSLERSLQAAARQAELAELSVTVSRENLALLEQRRELGLAAVVDLLQADLDLRRAQGSLVEARAAWLKALWNRQRLAGEF
jgi:outer membrane protein TolC